jgi:hypothetical protein
MGLGTDPTVYTLAAIVESDLEGDEKPSRGYEDVERGLVPLLGGRGSERLAVAVGKEEVSTSVSTRHA